MYNEFNLTTPSDLHEDFGAKFKEAVQKFEDQFKNQLDDEEYYHLVIVGEYSRGVCSRIEKEYMNVGWGKVVCKTSTENGERGGLTGLRLWRNKPKENENI